MTGAELLPFDTDSEWAEAERTAAQHRYRRLHPDPRVRRRNRVIAPIAVVCWIAAVVAALLGLVTPGDRGYSFGFASYGGLVLFAVLGGWWLTSSGRYLIRGSASSIRTAIPPAERRSVRRQLALRRPLDPLHQDVVLELAHQGRELMGGQIALYAFYVPLYLDIAHNSHDRLAAVVLAIGTVGLVVGAIMLVVTNARLTRLLQQHDEAAPEPTDA